MAELKDGTRIEIGSTMPSQSMKKDAGKVPLELLPTRPLEAVARVLGVGAKKYAPNLWRKGIAYSRVYAATLRHMWAWWRGEEYDTADGTKDGSLMPDEKGNPTYTGEHHLACAICELCFLLEYRLNQEPRRAACDDRQLGDIACPCEPES